MSDWPFELWLIYGVKGLGLSPENFWAMSVSDWLNLTAKNKMQTMARTDLETLMQTFPDEVIS